MKVISFTTLLSILLSCPFLFADEPALEKNIASILLEPYALNSVLQLQNRIVMAPMTRCFASGHTPNDRMVEYYRLRGTVGLIISEATMIDRDASGYPNTPGIFSKEQIAGWQKVSSSVHRQGGKFFLQLWHAGMMSHPIFRRGKQPISASEVPAKKEYIPRTGKTLKYMMPRSMNRKDMNEIAHSFLQAGLNAMEAGCDGIELHASNGYLLDSFLHYYTNKRQDEYGGNPANMCRYILEIVDVLANSIGAERIGIRLSPIPIQSMDNVEEDPRDQKVFALLLSELEKRGIAYVHTAADDDQKETGKLGMPVSTFVRTHFKGNIIGCGSYTPETGAKAIDEKQFELVAFGRLLIANPNLVEVIRDTPHANPRLFHGSMLNHLH